APTRCRGWSARSGLGPDDDLADDLAALHRPLAVGGLFEREHSVHDRAQLAGERESRDRQEIIVRPAVRALDRLLAAEQISDIRLADRPRRRAASDQATALAESADRALPGSGAHRLDDDVDAALAGQPAHR